MMSFKVDPDWKDKDSKVEKFRELYEKNDFLVAYSKHTDLRVQADPHQAIGGEWEAHGVLQRDFLIDHGLKPEHKMLDLGCGTGRLARKLVPYLDVGNYVGADISPLALAHAKSLSVTESWADRVPGFVQIDTADGTLNGLKSHGPFEFIWAHSVFTHLPPDAIEAIVASLHGVLAGMFLFTYKRGDKPERTGLKQWRYPFKFFESIAKTYGFKTCALATVWPASQRTGLISR